MRNPSSLQVLLTGVSRLCTKGSEEQAEKEISIKNILLGVFGNFAEMAVQRLKCNKSSCTEEAI